MTADVIGVRMSERKSCAGVDHLPGCYNPWLNRTYCLCGGHSWPRCVGEWKNRPLYEVTYSATGRPVGHIVGWDVYFMHAPTCTNESEPHLCGISS